jgi:hypothetical protein
MVPSALGKGNFVLIPTAQNSHFSSEISLKNELNGASGLVKKRAFHRSNAEIAR